MTVCVFRNSPSPLSLSLSLSPLSLSLPLSPSLLSLSPSLSQLTQLREREIPRLEAARGQKEAEVAKLKTELSRVSCTRPHTTHSKSLCTHHTYITPRVSLLLWLPHQMEDKVSGFREGLDQVRVLLPRVSRTAQLCRDLEKLDSDIGSEESKLGGGDSSRSHVLVNRELQEAQMKA